MYAINRNKTYKLRVWFGLIPSIPSLVYVYLSLTRVDVWDSFSIFMMSLGFGYPLYTLFYTIKYFDKRNNYDVFKIDDDGIFLRPNRNEHVFIPWGKIKYLTFAYDDCYGTKVAILQYNKESHYMLLTEYFTFLKRHLYPRKAVKAAYEHIDYVEKIKEIKAPFLGFNYESGVWYDYIKKGNRRDR